MGTRGNFTQVTEDIFPGLSEPVRGESDKWRLRERGIRPPPSANGSLKQEIAPEIPPLAIATFRLYALRMCTAQCVDLVTERRRTLRVFGALQGVLRNLLSELRVQVIGNLNKGERNKQKKSKPAHIEDAVRTVL